MKCKICNGKNDIVCPACIGAKELDAGAQCARCKGVGRIVCPKCDKELEHAILYGDGSKPRLLGVVRAMRGKKPKPRYNRP